MYTHNLLIISIIPHNAFNILFFNRLKKYRP